MPEIELRIDAQKPWEGQVCDIRDSKDKAEITKVDWIDGKPILRFRLLGRGLWAEGRAIGARDWQDDGPAAD